MDVPKDSGGLAEGRKAEAKGTSWNCEGVINLKVGLGGGGGFPNKKGNSSFGGVVCKRGKNVKSFVNGTEGKQKGLMGAVNFLEKHNIDWGEKSVKVSDFSFLTGAIVVKKSTTVPSRDADWFERLLGAECGRV